MINATIKLVLDARPLSNGKYTVYLRIIKDRDRKLISTGLKCEKEHFVNEQFTKKHKNHQVDNQLLLRYKSKALDVLRDFQINETDFTLREFKEKYSGFKGTKNVTVIDFFEEIIEEQLRSGKISNAKVYKDTKLSLEGYHGKYLKFKDVTIGFLEKYEVYLRQKGNKGGGISIKMRTFRALFNKARKRNLIPEELYPFRKYNFSRLKSETTKTSLTIDEFKKIKNLDLSNNPHLVDSHNYFMFSVYTRGLNFKDAMHLKWSNIRDNRIYYVRSKTKRKINLEIIEPAKEILSYYRAQNRTTQYVFPILHKENLTPQQIFNRRHKEIGKYNENLKEIAELAGVKKKITSYVARHSFATILKMTGTPIEKISEMMAHKDVSVTISYLKEFSNEELDKENRKFTDL